MLSTYELLSKFWVSTYWVTLQFEIFFIFLAGWEFLGIWESHGNGNIPMGMSANGNGNFFGNFSIFPKFGNFGNGNEIRGNGNSHALTISAT